MNPTISEIVSALNDKVFDQAVIAAAHIERTVDRKGYRHALPYINSSPYKDKPKTRVTIEFEVEDDVTPAFKALVDSVIAAEQGSRARRVAERKLEKAKRALAEAQAEYGKAIKDEE